MFGFVMKAGAKNVKLTIDEVGPMGGDTVMTAYERSHYTFYTDTGAVFDEGKYVADSLGLLII